MLNRLFSLKCPECGGRIDENDRYCPHCETDLESSVGQEVTRTETRDLFENAQRIYDEGGNLKEALQDCDLAIQYESASAAAHNLRGLILDALGRKDDAIASYREALRIEPSHEDAKANLADAEHEQQNKLSDIEIIKGSPWLRASAVIVGLLVILLVILLCLVCLFIFVVVLII